MRYWVLVIIGGIAGSALYSQGVPPWLVYVLRRVIYELGS